MTMSSFQKELMKLRSSNYIVAYLDVLGATEYMKQDSEQFLNDLNTIYENALNDVMFTNVVTKKNIDIKIFSDNILIMVKVNRNDINKNEKIEKIVNLVNNIYCNALDCGYLIRGGITEGKFYKNSTFVFGKALVEAVRLEEKIAIYPRIVIQDELVSLIPQYVILDNDGKYYLNSFVTNGLRRHIMFKVNLIEQLKKYHDKDDVKQKIMWLVNYFNNYYGKQYGGSIERTQITQQEINEALNVNLTNEVYSE